jgi:hypothetical protein
MHECGHVFGDHCIANFVETATQNNNKCPLCREILFQQEDFNEHGYRIRGNADEESSDSDFDSDSDEEQVPLTRNVWHGPAVGEEADVDESGEYVPDEDDEIDIDYEENDMPNAKVLPSEEPGFHWRDRKGHRHQR